MHHYADSKTAEEFEDEDFDLDAELAKIDAEAEAEEQRGAGDGGGDMGEPPPSGGALPASDWEPLP